MKKIKYFSTTWCGPCRMFKPIMQELTTEGLNIEFIDADQDTTQAQLFNIRSVPTCVVLDNEQEVYRWTGVVPKEEVRRRYNS